MFLSSWDKMNVRVAAQTLSNSVAQQLTVKLNAGAWWLRATRDFVQYSNDLFDLINARTFLRPETKHRYFAKMRKKLEWFLLGEDRENEKNWLARKTLFDMQLMVEGFIGYAEDYYRVYDSPDLSLAPGMFNQDSVENFFGRIRACAGGKTGNTNPTEYQYAQRLASMMASDHAKLNFNPPKGNCGTSGSGSVAERKLKAALAAPIRDPERGSKRKK
jgi:hypothetical protein